VTAVGCRTDADLQLRTGIFQDMIETWTWPVLKN
jgi:hypothetical protein